MHPEIDNPEYSADSNIYKFDKISVLGLDLWQVREKNIMTSINIAIALLSYSVTNANVYLR